MSEKQKLKEEGSKRYEAILLEQKRLRKVEYDRRMEPKRLREGEKDKKKK